MKTDLPQGAWIEYRSRGGLRFARVVLTDDPRTGQPIKGNMIGLTPPAGATIHRGVWKGDDEFQVRKVYTYKP